MTEITPHTPYVPTDEDRKFAEASIERAKLQAAAYLPQLLDIVAEKALDPHATNKAVLDAADFAYRVSGMAKRQEDQNDKGRFVFNINFRSGKVSVDQEKVLEIEPTDLTDIEIPTVDTILDNAPAYVKAAMDFDDDDVDTLDFSD